MTLTPFSAQVRDCLAAEFPDLVPFFTEQPSGVFRVRVPHPRIASGLNLSTDRDELTLGFQQWHTHGELLGGTTPTEHLAASVALLRSILNGEALLAVSFIDGRFADAWVTIRPDHEQSFVDANERVEVGTWADLAARRVG